MGLESDEIDLKSYAAPLLMHIKRLYLHALAHISLLD